jgi:hypothetical protein
VHLDGERGGFAGDAQQLDSSFGGHVDGCVGVGDAEVGGLVVLRGVLHAGTGDHELGRVVERVGLVGFGLR